MTIQNKDLLPCARCREECFIVAKPVDSHGRSSFMVRPHRISRCKHYKAGASGRICKATADTELNAVANWNASQRESLIEQARRYKMTSDERESQAKDFAYGNTRLENSAITMEDIEKAATG